MIRTNGASVTGANGIDLGRRLRRVRNQQQLSLAEVEYRSDGEWRAVVVGAYERGERAISMSRLARLAAFYGVPMADLLPDPDAPSADPADRVTLDLTRLPTDDPRLAAVRRFADRILEMRSDRNGRVLTLRGGDLDAIAAATDSTPAAVRTMLVDEGVLLDLDLGSDADQLLTANLHASRSRNPAVR